MTSAYTVTLKDLAFDFNVKEGSDNANYQQSSLADRSATVFGELAADGQPGGFYMRISIPDSGFVRSSQPSQANGGANNFGGMGFALARSGQPDTIFHATIDDATNYVVSGARIFLIKCNGGFFRSPFTPV